MNGAMEISVDHLIVETAAERRSAEGIPERLREGFELLAEKLQGAPAARRLALSQRVIEKLDLSTLPSEELLGSRGAERLAEELYRQIVEGMS